MMTEVREALAGCSLVLLIEDAARRRDPGDQFVLELVKKAKTPGLPPAE